MKKWVYCSLSGLMFSSLSHATTTSYADPAAWNSAVSGVTNQAIPQPVSSSGFDDIPTSVTYGNVTFSSNSSISQDGLSNTGTIWSSVAPVISSQGTDVQDIVLTFPTAVQAFSLDYGTFAYLNYGTSSQTAAPYPPVTFTLSNGDSFSLSSASTYANIYDVPNFVGITDSDTFSSVTITAPAPASGGFAGLNINDVSYATSVVPLPSAAWLFSSGVASLSLLRRRKK